MNTREAKHGSGRLRVVVEISVALALSLGLYIGVSNWKIGQEPQDLLRAARAAYRTGDEVKAAVLIARARKQSPEPEIAAKLNELYREIVVVRKLRVIEGLIVSKRFQAAQIQLRRVLSEQPGNPRATILKRTVEAALVAKAKAANTPLSSSM